LVFGSVGIWFTVFYSHIQNSFFFNVRAVRSFINSIFKGRPNLTDCGDEHIQITRLWISSISFSVIIGVTKGIALARRSIEAIAHN